MLTNALCTVEEASAIIDSAAVVGLAGDESLLSRLPAGCWVGGTIPYFMGQEGGVASRERIFVTEFPVDPGRVAIRTYGADDLPNLVSDAPEHGFSLVIIPASTPVLFAYAQHAPEYPGLFLKPIVGWVAGVAMDDVGSVPPRTFDGSSGETSTERAVVLHASLPAEKVARVGMINLFRGGAGDVITFPNDGFSVTDCWVNGNPCNFARYLGENGVDTRFPLVADYHGAQVNSSFLSIDAGAGRVTLYTPIFAGIEYRLAQPITDYAGSFAAAVERADVEAVFACNCILNYRYGELEGKKTGHVTGPITFGEIAYQLVNQTLVYLSIDTVETDAWHAEAGSDPATARAPS